MNNKIHLIPLFLYDFYGATVPVDLDKCARELHYLVWDASRPDHKWFNRAVHLIASSPAPMLVKLDALSYILDEPESRNLTLWVRDYIDYCLRQNVDDMVDPEINGPVWKAHAQTICEYFYPIMRQYIIPGIYQEDHLLQALCERGEWFDSSSYETTHDLPFDVGEQSFAEALQTLWMRSLQDWQTYYPELFTKADEF